MGFEHKVLTRATCDKCHRTPDDANQEPWAWSVSCPKGHEFDALIFPSEDEAQEQVDDFRDSLEEGDTDETNMIPLFPTGAHQEWQESPARAVDYAMRLGWRQIETATGSKLLCRVCGARADLPKLNAALDLPGPVQDAVLNGVARDVAETKELMRDMRERPGNMQMRGER